MAPTGAIEEFPKRNLKAGENVAAVERLRFIQNQHAVNQLAKPFFAGMDGEYVVCCGGPWQWAHSDALGRDVAERLKQVGDRLDGHGGDGGEAH